MSQKMNKLLPAHIKRGTSKPGTCILDDRKKDKGGFGKICDFNISGDSGKFMIGLQSRVAEPSIESNFCRMSSLNLSNLFVEKEMEQSFNDSFSIDKEIFDELLELCSWYDSTEDGESDDLCDDLTNDYGDSDEEDEIIRRMIQRSEKKASKSQLLPAKTSLQPPPKLFKRETSLSLSSLRLNSVILKSPPSQCKVQASPGLKQFKREASDFWDNLNDVDF